MIATIAVIAAITEKKNSAIIWKPLSGDRSDNDRGDRTFYISAIVVAATAGKWFHMTAMIAAITDFFFSAIAAITAMVAIIWKPGFNLIMVYFKRKDCLHRVVRLNNCSNLVECVNFSDLSGATGGLFISFSE